MNYLKLNDRHLFYYLYFYFDKVVNNYYLADKVFNANGLKVKFISDYSVENSDMCAHIVKVKKKDVKLFDKCMYELTKEMLILGHVEYERECDEYMQKIKDTFKERGINYVN